MNGNTESTSNSIKFAPMPMSVLMAQLMPLQSQADSPDSSYTSEEDSDNYSAQTAVKKQSPTVVNKGFLTPSQKSPPKDNKVFASERKLPPSSGNKENSVDAFGTNQTHPNKDMSKKTQFNHPSSEVKRNVLTVHNNNARVLKITNSATKKTPDMKPPSLNMKKSTTPKIKSGIRKFTPGSGRKANIKTPQSIQTRDRVRCELFTKKKEEPPPLVAVPETPVNKKPMPTVYAATPSYPQGVISGNSKLLFKSTKIKDKKYMFIKALGTGGSSEVFKVLEAGTSCEYAMKCVYMGGDQDLAQGYINEVRLLRELQNSDRVVRLYDYEYDSQHQTLRMVLEVGETDLSSFLKTHASLSPALVVHYWEEMLHAVHYIHEHGVIHADLKPANFLLVSGQLKLIDFGIASSISGDATSVVRAQATGTYNYISPEALMGGAGGYGVAGSDSAQPIKISFRSDVWSLGCILYSMVYGRTPFSHIPNLAKLAAILDPNHRIDYPPREHFPHSLLAALKWCLTYNARARPSVRELLRVPYLQAPAPAPPPALPPPLLEKLRAALTPHELQLVLQSRGSHAQDTVQETR